MMNKKTMSMILAFVLAISLVGCGVGNTDPTDGTEATGTVDATGGVGETAGQETTAGSTEETTDNENQTVPPETTKPQETTGSDATEPDNSKETKPVTTEHKHSYASKVVAPTCTEKGYTKYTCSCGASYEGNETPAMGHSYKDTVVAPTINAEGYTIHECARCNYSYKDNYTDKLENEEPKNPTVPAHKHNYSGEVVAPTCTENGYTVYTCSCGDSYNGDTVNAVGHSWGEWRVTKEATDAREGEKVRTCSACGETERVTIPKIEGHVHDYYVTVVEVTCTTEGYTLHVCKTCPGSSEGAIYKSDIVSPLGHDFSGGTCTRCGGYESGQLNYAAAAEYGNQYAVEKYGWVIASHMNSDNAGYYPPSSASVEGVLKKGGQSYLNKLVREKVDSLYSNLTDCGVTKASVNCEIKVDENGRLWIYVYYGG